MMLLLTAEQIRNLGHHLGYPVDACLLTLVCYQLVQSGGLIKDHDSQITLRV